jgi:hypothetical protein
MVSRDLYTSSLMPPTERTSDGTPRRAFDRPLVWWSLAAASLLLGYADLARGGETIAPVLLVLGYCVLVPVAILRG